MAVRVLLASGWEIKVKRDWNWTYLVHGLDADNVLERVAP
jgi:hypothetical protein